ncbi:N-acetyltransferase YodP [Aneurinibacillus soli]|uniref:N-acetyltransferase YodP n=1 Tax=Aneurinibacillus soli TaxID=1500254 RepID=A0A0U5BHX2_9BACL|nr:N-acetyltransferase YodP [Aneurinibacillus soli]
MLRLPYRINKEVLPHGYTVRAACVADAAALAQLYGAVFQTYPTPMNESAYIRKVMEGGTIFYVAENAGRIVSAASAEVNRTYHNAEMTDCATYPEHRQYGLMRHLIRALEEDLRHHHLYCVYSLARSLSFGMNAVFHQLGYTYSGRMANNCNIYDKLEDMSLWVKDISAPVL